jgi:hypothetical protein
MAISYSLYKTISTDAVGVQTEGLDGAAGTKYSKMWGANDRDWGLTVITDGTLTGVWTLWATDKDRPVETDDTDWVDMSAHADFVETNPAGAATKWRVNSTLITATNLRLKYVAAGGVGNIFAYVTSGN